MKKINNFKLTDIPHHEISVVVSSQIDYEMERYLLADDYPHTNEFTIIQGSHCSCYGFDETQWEAITYEKEEFHTLMKLWIMYGYPEETTFAKLALITTNPKPATDELWKWWTTKIPVLVEKGTT
jgi:hypothetical protein